MTRFVAAWRSEATWRVRRPLVRRRLRRVLAARPDRLMVPVRQLAFEAGLEAMSRRQFHAALTDLVNAGLVEGVRGAEGWLRVRSLEGLRGVRRRRVRIPPGVPIGGVRLRSMTAGATGPSGWRLLHLVRRRDRHEEQADAQRADGRLAAGLNGAAAATALWPAPVTTRTFSVTGRVQPRRGGRLLPGLALFVVALAAGWFTVSSVMRSSAEPPASATRAGWYHEAALAYVEAYRAGRPGFGLPYQFTELTGVRADAPRADLLRGMEKYLQVALYTGYPSQGGILAWARSEFGELPAGEAAGAWLKQAAQTYAARSLAGTPGYELTPALRKAGGIAEGEQNPEAVAAGLEEALRVALYTGTPDTGGILDWARRSFGNLPRD